MEKEPLVLRGGQVSLREGMRRLDLRLADGRISAMGENLPLEGAKVKDASGCYVVPGFIDAHTHGGAGVDVNHADLADLKKLAAFFASQGVTSFLPTVLSGAPDEMAQSLRAVADARDASMKPGWNGARVLGCHLEGPHLCSAYKGAMPEQYLTVPDPGAFEKLQEAGRGCILRLTLSPEMPGAPEFTAWLVRQGVSVSLGHSGADYRQTMDCIRQGAASATHTMNAMRPLHQHEPGILGAVLESDVYCEAICDGLHLHPGIVRLLVKTKGLGRIVAVTDSIMAAGLQDGEYVLGVQPIVVTDGDARLKNGGSRAGSTLTMAKALQNLASFTGLPLHQAIVPLTAAPVALLGLECRKGRIQTGMDADITLLRPDLSVLMTIAGQETVYDAGLKIF